MSATSCTAGRCVYLHGVFIKPRVIPSFSYSLNHIDGTVVDKPLPYHSRHWLCYLVTWIGTDYLMVNLPLPRRLELGENESETKRGKRVSERRGDCRRDILERRKREESRERGTEGGWEGRK